MASGKRRSLLIGLLLSCSLGELRGETIAVTVQAQVPATLEDPAPCDGVATTGGLVNDCITGKDTIKGSAGGDIINGADQWDSKNYFYGGNGDDRIHGNAKSYSNLYGSEGDDVLYAGHASHGYQLGGKGGDILLKLDNKPNVYLLQIGGDGNDKILPGPAEEYDQMIGSGGNDVFYLKDFGGLTVPSVMDFTSGEDVICLPESLTFTDLEFKLATPEAFEQPGMGIYNKVTGVWYLTVYASKWAPVELKEEDFTKCALKTKITTVSFIEVEDGGDVTAPPIMNAGASPPASESCDDYDRTLNYACPHAVRRGDKNCACDENCLRPPLGLWDQCHSNGCSQCVSGTWKLGYDWWCTKCTIPGCLLCQDFVGCAGCRPGWKRVFDKECGYWKCEGKNKDSICEYTRRLYQQCDGQNYSGDNCCTYGNECTYYSQWYSQCTKPAVDTEKGCIREFGKCGGKGYNTNGFSCCQGSVCVETNEYYSQCISSSEP